MQIPGAKIQQKLSRSSSSAAVPAGAAILHSPLSHQIGANHSQLIIKPVHYTMKRKSNKYKNSTVHPLGINGDSKQNIGCTTSTGELHYTRKRESNKYKNSTRNSTVISGDSKQICPEISIVPIGSEEDISQRNSIFAPDDLPDDEDKSKKKLGQKCPNICRCLGAGEYNAVFIFW